MVTPTTEPPWQLRHFEANLLAMERYPSILASSLTSKRKELNQNVPYEQRGPFYGALRKFATRHRLTWNGERYVEELSDQELEGYLLGETNWPSLNHFISTRYAVACMSEQHRSRLWCRAKQLGADWDAGEKRFTAREN